MYIIIIIKVFKARPTHFAAFFNLIMDAMTSDEADQVSIDYTIITLLGCVLL